MHFEPIRRRKLHEEVAARIEALIVSGRFGVGDQLPSERELMQLYDVGRPAVREALLMLERMGLVALSAGERARVVKPTPEALLGQLSGAARHLLAADDGVRHFQEARLLFETGLARHAAEHATKEDVGRLERALAANRAAVDDPVEFNRTDVTFHYVLAEIPRNPIFTALHHAMVEWLTDQRTISLELPRAFDHACDAHARIYEAVAARDPDRAEREMREHLLTVASYYWEVKERHARIRHTG